MDSLVPRPFPPTGNQTTHGHVSHVFVKLRGSADLVIKGLINMRAPASRYQERRSRS